MPTGARTVTIVRAPKVDKLSPTPAGAAVETQITGVIILPRQTYEQGQGWITLDGYDIYVLPSSRVGPPGGEPRSFQDSDVLHSDVVKIGTERWEVDGRPAGYDKGTTRKATLIKVKRAGA